MKKSRFTETQIVKILKEVEGGRLVKEVCLLATHSRCVFQRQRTSAGRWTSRVTGCSSASDSAHSMLWMILTAKR